MPFGPVRVAVTPRREVTFLSDDSVHLRGTYWEPPEEGAASLLLIHDFGSNRKVWNPYVAMFHSRGWGVMTFDLRGHGESVRQDMHAALLEPEAQDLAAETYARDVRAAISFLARQPKSDAARIGISGVGAGSDLAYAAAGRGWGAASTVLFGLDEPRARIFSGYGPFAPRSVYLLYGSENETSARSADAMIAHAAYPAETFPYATAETGLTLVEQQQPEILARAIAWFIKTL